MTRACRRILAVFLTAAGTVAFVWHGPAFALSAEEIARKLQKKYAGTSDFAADFVQDTTVRAVDQRVTYSGRVYFKKPGKMRWDYNRPKGQTIVADGKFLWFYQPAEKQVIKSPFDSGFRSSLPVSFLTGVGNLQRDFVLELVPSEPGAGSIRLKAAPRGQDAGFGELELILHPKTLDIVEARVTDLTGNLTRIRLSNIRRQIGINDSLFSFRVPKGVEVVNAEW
jgi:outer membrane lipoprotein carrier protein